MIVYSRRMLERIKALGDRPWTVALIVAAAAQLLFMINMGRPGTLVFDEVHYVPAARALLELEGARNIEHPLLGKELIAAGIALFGDDPFGWRFFPVLAGTASVLGIFALVWLMLGSMRASLGAAAFALLNQTLYVQARTAMLDVFLGAFIVWAMVLMLWAMRAPAGKAWARWIGASALLGCALAVKWAALPYIALAGCAFLCVRVRDARRAGRPIAHALGAREQTHWQGLAAIPALAALGAISVAVYLLTFAPAFFYAVNPIDLPGLFRLQGEMYALQTQVLPSHTYQSEWWSWPLMIRPIWYFYEWFDGAQRGVLLIGNPVVMWGGLIAVLACYWAWIKERAAVPLAAALLWTGSLAIYVIIPKSLGFYYYYHLSGLFLCVALAIAFHHFDRGRGRGFDEWFAAAALVAFIYFFPILSAAPLEAAGSFEYWMWFPSWR